MSHSHGEIIVGDVTIRYFEYNGTSDICIPHLWDSREIVSKHWRDDVEWRKCTCGKTPTNCFIYSSYGGGFHWPGTVCLDCNVIIGPLETDNSVDGRPPAKPEHGPLSDCRCKACETWE